MYRIVIDLGLGVVMLSRKQFETTEEAQAFKDEAGFSGMEIKTQEQVDAITERIVLFPIKE